LRSRSEKISGVEMSMDLEAHRQELDDIIAREKPRGGALIPVLHQAQELYGYLFRELQDYIADALVVPRAAVYGVVTFYAFFTMKPRGRHRIGLCLGTACYVRGASENMKSLKKKLGIGVGQTTPDGRFTLEICRCIGSCSQAPAILIDKTVHGRLQEEDLSDMLTRYG
jgi:NADP-reducing hydrogenase subunit HndA